MGQLVQGGGTAGISIGNVSMQLEGVAREFKMVIPPYFALILRAFSVIEGIALKHDPEYAIVSRCFPYLSRRLLTDNDPRVRAALKQLLYGNSQRLNVPQLEKLMAAFSTFTVASSGKSAQGPTFSDAAMYEERVKGRRAPADVVLDANMKEALLVVFSKDGSYAQVRTLRTPGLRPPMGTLSRLCSKNLTEICTDSGVVQLSGAVHTLPVGL